MITRRAARSERPGPSGPDRAPGSPAGAPLFRIAADPRSPRNPFHEAASATRAAGIGLFAEVLRGPKVKVPKDIAAALPALLWTYSMDMVPYWIHDDSEQRANTRRSVELAMLRDLDGFTAPG